MKEKNSYNVFKISLLFVFLGSIISCNNSTVSNNSVAPSACQLEIINSLPNNLVIAHRGTTFYAPEETEEAMRWARNVGADYLEFDLQRTKDGYLIALHDERLVRTTDVNVKFPTRINNPVSSFTYKELLTLDAGSWFNEVNSKKAKISFIGLDILTLEDIIHIAEGKKIKRDSIGKRITKINKGRIITVYEEDQTDNGNRPGVYIETKVPELFLNIENDLKRELIKLGWYNNDVSKLKKIHTFNNKVKWANSKNRVFLQTFSKESLIRLNKTFKRKIPICFLLWRGNEKGDIPDDKLETFQKWIEFGIQNGASVIGPSIGGLPNNYVNLLDDKHFEIIRKYNLKIHAYSFDTRIQMKEYNKKVNGMFSNKANEALFFYQNKVFRFD